MHMLFLLPVFQSFFGPPLVLSKKSCLFKGDEPMDLVELLCPNCGKMLTVATKYSGEVVRCPSCACELSVPLEDRV